jgi:outer membrane protein assembly factor BamB
LQWAADSEQRHFGKTDLEVEACQPIPHKQEKYTSEVCPGAAAKAKRLPPGPNGFRYLPGKAFGKVITIRADNGQIAWELKTRTPLAAGMLATAGGLLFTGNAEGNFQAFDAEKGALLWSYQTRSGIRMSAGA